MGCSDPRVADLRGTQMAHGPGVARAPQDGVAMGLQARGSYGLPSRASAMTVGLEAGRTAFDLGYGIPARLAEVAGRRPAFERLAELLSGSRGRE